MTTMVFCFLNCAKRLASKTKRKDETRRELIVFYHYVVESDWLLLSAEHRGRPRRRVPTFNLSFRSLLGRSSSSSSSSSSSFFLLLFSFFFLAHPQASIVARKIRFFQQPSTGETFNEKKNADFRQFFK